MKKVLKDIFICIMIVLGGCPAFALDAVHYVFQPISDGAVPLSEVNCIYKEPNSYVWIGTPKGLYRYDGGTMKSYVHAEPESSLPENMIWDILADKEENLWVLTPGGVCIYNRQDDCFRTVADSEGRTVTAFSACLADDILYLGGKDIVYRYDAKAHCAVPVAELKTKKRLRIDGMVPLSSQLLLCKNMDEGVFILDMNAKTFTKAPYDCSKEVSAMLVDGERVWIATYNHGLSCFDKLSGKRTGFYNTVNSDMSSNVILSLVKQDSLLWIGTDGGGINILDPETGSVNILTHRQADERSFPGTSIKVLYKDSNNAIWAGSVRNGVINIKRSMVCTFTDVPLGSPYGLSNPTVLCLYQKPGSPYIWIGTDGEGINRLDTRTYTFTHYPKTRYAKVASIAEFGGGKLLLSLYTRGFFLFDMDSGNLEPLKMSDSEINRLLLYKRQTLNLFNESEGNILMFGRRIYRYDVRTGRIGKIVSPELPYVGGSLLPVGQEGGYTYMRDNRNLYRLAVGGDKMECLSDFPSTEIINSASLDGEGNVWIGSNGKIIRFDIAGKHSEDVYAEAFRGVNSVIRDGSDRLWIGANNNLYVYFLKEKRFSMLGESDGVAHNEYLGKPMLRDNDGDIYLGGIRGLLHISRFFSFDETDKPLIRLTGVQIDGVPIKNISWDGNPHVNYPWGSKALSLFVMSEEKDIFRERLYRLTMQNAGGIQNFESASPEISLRLLPPGEHKIFVSCNRQNGEWTDPRLLLTVDALPPWYRTWVFKLVAPLLLIALIFAVSGMYYRKKTNRLKLAMKEKEILLSDKLD